MRTAIPALRGSFPLLHDDQIETAVNDAVLDQIRKSEDSPAPTPLYAAAWRNCRDIAQSEAHRKAREREWSDEYLPRSAKHPTIATDENAEEFVERIAELMPDDDMRATFRLWLAGERRTAAYAARLGREGDSSRTHVNREKNRLRMFLRRNPEVRRFASDLVRGGR